MQFGNKKLRNEWKYYIRFYDYLALKSRLRLITQLDPNSTDSEGYQIRIYNHSDDVIKLERKSKYDGYICKEAASLSRAEYESIMAGETDFLLARKESLLHDFYLDSKNHLFQPRVVTDYIREAYLMEIGNVRVTFDKQLMTNVNTLDIFDPNMKTVNVIHEPKMIMEVKFDNFLPTNIRSLLRYFSSQRSAISKYLICREESKAYYKL
ncbi:polyphosphate polymerase domain-containing protein [Brevibacillus centrosporus]|uniref:VTC domain-containing protein n=1 Tax=Brevibacillus centrosporus TaxID=54910 RepID=A0A1I3VMN1_9BACL|nr:polyphosphate polymerase domain-containing protein [Brevibacillus centrosporus]MED4908078.1 polyphosphate polymerase domain-containing protein [Brevibacillus centrosporus]SFJ95517.1 VTC domain-containing protein [Brevibacillus centrosporus]